MRIDNFLANCIGRKRKNLHFDVGDYTVQLMTHLSINLEESVPCFATKPIRHT